MKVYEKIAAVTSAMASEGIGKSRKNEQQGYKFRGIDDVYNALSRQLAVNGLCILPRMIERGQVERQSAKGGVLFYVTVTAEFDVVAAEDGSKHIIRTYGEAMDSGDKATNKAMSAAYKYACMQMFCIPTEGDNDADATTHEVIPTPADESVVIDYIEAHKSAADLTSLQKVHADAVKYCRGFGDKKAEQRIVKAKDDRKAQLMAKPEDA